MTPEERDLVADLFQRLADLERQPRDLEAERAIREGLARAPNAIYALVQSVLVQDEALKAADDRIRELEDALEQAQAGSREPKSFLGSVRDSLLGRDEPRGSVPPVGSSGDRPMGTPPGFGGGRPDPWGRDAAMQSGGMAGGPMGGPMGAPIGGEPSRGGSFLGTAAAVAAGAIGGGLLMQGIRSALGGQQGGGPFSGALDHLSRGGESGGRPASDAASGELARDAGLNDIGQNRRAGLADMSQGQNLDEEEEPESEDDSDFDDDGSYENDTDTA